MPGAARLCIPETLTMQRTESRRGHGVPRCPICPAARSRSNRSFSARSRSQFASGQALERQLLQKVLLHLASRSRSFSSDISCKKAQGMTAWITECVLVPVPAGHERALPDCTALHGVAQRCGDSLAQSNCWCRVCWALRFGQLASPAKLVMLRQLMLQPNVDVHDPLTYAFCSTMPGWQAHQVHYAASSSQLFSISLLTEAVRTPSA